MVRRRVLVAAAVAAAGFLAAAAGTAIASTSGTGSVPGSIGSAPPAAAGPETAGTITVAEWASDTPTWIFPVIPGADNSIGNATLFTEQMWRPTYWAVNGVTPEVNTALSLANLPVYSHGDRTVSITLKNSDRWSDGTPVTANDLLFDIDLIKAAVRVSPANWADYVPGGFPDDVASTAEPNASTLVLHLTGPVNPMFFTENILGETAPLPAQAWARGSVTGASITDWNTSRGDAVKIFDFLSSQSRSLGTYATSPLWQAVDGPYRLSAFNATTGGYTMVPNTEYGGPHASAMSAIKVIPFTTDDAVHSAMQAGTLDVANFDLNYLPLAVSLSGYHYFGEPDFGMQFAMYNFKDTTGHFGAIASQLYFRQAMAHLQNQQGWVKAFMGGAADPAYGPIPAYPQSPYLPSDARTDPYPFSVQDAITLLTDHGWAVHPGGTDTCVNPSRCGAGIPAGTKLAFSYAVADDEVLSSMASDLATQARRAGIAITVQASSYSYILTNDNDATDPARDSAWAMADFGGYTDATYPTTYILFNVPNLGDYSNATADALISASVTSSNPAAVRNEASFLTANQPVLFQPNGDYLWVWKDTVSGPPASFENLTQFSATPEFWYLTR
ncbi:MAG TPA: ABC transporter substrate-binding protein [Streptosporangiaceae bacterium]|nr:ABC transporter substrate-binding protein [Streptosporangiaceae bacterium]